MAELRFNIHATYDELAKARQELGRLRDELDKTTKASSPDVVQNLTDEYQEQEKKIRDLTSSIKRYSTVMGDDYTKKMQSLTREVYNFEMQADASQRKVSQLTSEIAKMETRLRTGNVSSGESIVLNQQIVGKYGDLKDEKANLESLQGLAKESRTELQNMQKEYSKYSGSTTATADNVNIMTEALGNMVKELRNVPTVGEGASSLLNRLTGDTKVLATSLMGIGGVGFEQLAQKIFSTRSEFQQLEISFNTMLGSEQKAGALMDQLIDTAAKTPFDMGSITNGAKQLLAYGTEANEVNGILTKLGDISAGLSVPLGDLVYLYGTTMSQGKMFTQDLRQFMGRGIPMAESLGKIMGKTTQEVQDAVSKGEVGADLVKKAIEDMTSEGSKFGGLMEQQSQTLQGQWSNIEDGVEQMFNEMGKKSEGVFGTGLEFLGQIVDNWETVVKVVGAAAVAMGTYKAALMATATIQKVQNNNTIDTISANVDSAIEYQQNRANSYRSAQGKDTEGSKQSGLKELNEVVGNTDYVGNKDAEKLVQLKIQEAKENGLITEEMAQQLQAKRDMLVAQTQYANSQQKEVKELTAGLDEQMSKYREQESLFREKNGKDTKEYTSSRYSDIASTLSDTTNIGDEDVEAMVTKKLEEAQAEGLITQEQREQLQLKRNLLAQQVEVASSEQAEYENAQRAKQEAEEEAIAQKKLSDEIAKQEAIEEEKARIAERNKQISEASSTAYGKAIIQTEELKKAKDEQEEIVDRTRDEATEKQKALATINEEVKKQEELVRLKEESLVNDNSSVDTTGYGGYEDAYSDNENSGFVDLELEQAKLNELYEQQKVATDEAKESLDKFHDAKDNLKNISEQLAEAEDNELEIYKETGAEADEIEDLVREGIENKEADVDATNSQTTAMATNTSAERANSTAKNANAGATTTQTTSNAANTTSQNANTGSTQRNTVSEELNTEAKSQNSIVTSLMTLKTKAATVVQLLWKGTIDAVTMSLKGMWAAMLSNPITGILTLVTTAISVFAMFGDEEEDTADKTEDMGNKAAEASNKVRSLFAIASTGKASDHKDAINELKQAYDEYGIKLDETKMKSEDMGVQLEELKSHEEELIGVIEKRAIETERANQISSAYEDYNSNNDKAYSGFKDDIDEDDMSSAELGQMKNLVSQEDIDRLAELREQMKGLNPYSQAYQKMLTEQQGIYANLDNAANKYLANLGKEKGVREDVSESFAKYVEQLAINKQELNDVIDETNKSADAAENARNAVKNLSNEEELNALKTRYAKSSFKEINSEIQETIKLCAKKLNLDIKVNYDDSQLPAWIKKMDTKQLKNSIAARENWLNQKGRKKTDVMGIGGQWKTYEQVVNELAMMQARGTNEESKPGQTASEKKSAEKKKKEAEKSARQAENQAENRKKAEEDYAKTISSFSEKAEQTISSNRIAAMKDGYEKELAQIKANDEKQKKTIEDGIDKLVEARKKRDQTIWVNSGKNHKANNWKQTKTDEEYRAEVLSEQMKDGDGKNMGSTIGENMAKQIADVNAKTKKSEENLKYKQLQGMRDYLKEYGTFNEKKLAITQEYAHQIQEVQNSTDTDEVKAVNIKALEHKRDSEISAIDTSAIEAQIDWQNVFGTMTGVLEDQLRLTLENLQKYVKTDEFKKKDPADKKATYEAMDKLRGQVSGGEGTLNFGTLKAELNQTATAFQNMQTAVKQNNDAFKNLQEAQEEYEKALSTGDEEQIGSSKKVLESAQTIYDSTKSTMESTQADFEQLGSIYKSSVQDTVSGIEGTASGLQQMSGGSLKGAYDGLKTTMQSLSQLNIGGAVGQTINKVSDSLSNAGCIGQIISAILSLLDVFKEQGLGGIISSIIDSILGAINGILKNILSGKFIEQIVTSIVSGIGDILDTVIGALGSVLSFGALSSGGPSSWFENSNAKKVNKAIEKLTARNEILTTSIDALKESIDKSTGAQAIKNADEAQKLQKEKESNLKEQMELQMGYHGSHNSFNHYFKGFTQEQIDAVSKEMGREWSGSLSDIQSADEAQILLKHADMVQQIQDTGKGNYGGRVLEKLQDYADQAGKLDDIVDSLNESLTQVSFDSLKSDFINTLMDMDSSASDFATSFSKYMTQAILQTKIDQLLGDDLQSFYDEWTARAKANEGELSTTDISELRTMYESLAEKGLEIRDQVADITGYADNYDQDASSGAFESMSQETGEELNGRFTAVQIATEGTYQQIIETNAKLDQLVSLSGGGGDSMLTASVASISSGVGGLYTIADESRTILAQGLLSLQAIDERQEKWNKPMLQAFNDLKEMKDKIKLL